MSGRFTYTAGPILECFCGGVSVDRNLLVMQDTPYFSPRAWPYKSHRVFQASGVRAFTPSPLISPWILPQLCLRTCSIVFLVPVPRGRPRGRGRMAIFLWRSRALGRFRPGSRRGGIIVSFFRPVHMRVNQSDNSSQAARTQGLAESHEGMAAGIR